LVTLGDEKFSSNWTIIINNPETKSLDQGAVFMTFGTLFMTFGALHLGMRNFHRTEQLTLLTRKPEVRCT